MIRQVHFTYFVQFFNMWMVQVLISHDLGSIELAVYRNRKTHRMLKLVFFIYKCAGMLLTSTYITQWVSATPTLIGT